MNFSPRMLGTEEALGIASIIETVSRGGYDLEQDMKGRWHVWASDPLHANDFDRIARQLEPELYG